MNKNQTAGQQLATAILAVTIPNSAGAAHAGNWPNSAVFGVSYKCHDKQFPQVKHEQHTVYFDNVAELELWLDEKREWIKGTDYDFSMNYSVYDWDLGPNFKYSKSM